MPSHQSVPRIRVDLLDCSPHNLSPSSTLDIRDVLSKVKLSPKLLTEDFGFDDVDDALHLNEDHLRRVPPFPTGRQLPFFILHSYRAGLPFPIRSEAFELGDFFWDEENAFPILTAPTIPRMRLMIKEQLYVRKWVDTLTSVHPPRHIPWMCETPGTERKWISEGSIFPAAVVKYPNEDTKEHSRATDTNRSSALADEAPYSGKLCAFSEASPQTYRSIQTNTSTLHTSVKPTDVNPSIPSGESQTSQTSPHRTVRVSQGPSPSTWLPSGPSIGAISTAPDVPLAARRGKSLSGLKLRGSVIEQLEYPDIPTAFLGSPKVWSSQFDVFPVPSFTDHRSMLLDLKSKCVALGSGMPASIQESLHSQTGMTCTSLSVDEWTFARGLATFDDHPLGSIGSQVSREVIANTSRLVLDDSTVPAKHASFTAPPGVVLRLHSEAALQSPVSCSSDPPGDPLPPRPALVNPSTPPHVRGILKKVKSVRFEDMITKEIQDHTSPVAHLSQVPPERPSSLSAVSPERPCTPMPNTPRPSSGAVSVKEISALGKNIQEKKPTTKSRLPPKRTKASGKYEPIHLNISKTREASKATPATTPSELRCRIAHMENTKPVTVPRAQAKQEGLSTTETDVRRGIEGTTKNRLSTPLRNIFRFK